MGEEISSGQRTMTAAYDRTRAWMGEGGHRFRDRFLDPGLGNVERAVVVVGNLHYQVENGGLFQYVDNGYADERDASGRTAAAAAAAVCALHSALDPEVAGVLSELGIHAATRPRAGGAWGDDGESPAERAHREAADEIETRFADFGQDRRLAFLDAVAVAHDPAQDPFSLPVPAAGARRTVGDGPRHPEISVDLVGEDGNGYAIIARVRSAMRRARVDDAEIETFTREAKSGDYSKLLATVQAWVTTDADPAPSPRF